MIYGNLVISYTLAIQNFMTASPLFFFIPNFYDPPQYISDPMCKFSNLPFKLLKMRCDNGNRLLNHTLQCG